MLTFHGELAQSFPPIDIKFSLISDAISCCERIYPALRSRIIEQSRSGIGYQVLVNGEEIDQNELSFALPPNADIDIYPIVTGGSTTVKIIAGVALLATGAFGVGILGLSATSVALLGGSLLFSALYKAPKPDDLGKDSAKNFAFSGGLNTDKPGTPAPLICGKTIVGSVVVSYRISTELILVNPPEPIIAGPEPNPEPEPLPTEP